jgi:hypothetical protein
MENASKALLIAAAVLIAILLLTLFSYLMTRMSENTARIHAIMEQSEIAEFNQQFFNYEGRGTNIKLGTKNADDTVEFQYAEYQRMIHDGMDVREQLFADTGIYIWAIGLPDDQSITQEDAKRLSCQILLEDAGISEEQMVHFYPHFTYETGNPENPFWHVTWMPFDQGADVSTILDVAVYAHDGSICGYRIAVPVG